MTITHPVADQILLKLFLGWLCIILPTSAAAMFARLSDTALIEQADIIFQGEYLGPQTLKFNVANADKLDFEKYVGVLRIETLYQGKPTAQDIYISLPAPGLPVSSETMQPIKGQTGIWLLTFADSDSDIYFFNHPQQFISTDKGLELLSKFNLAP